MEITDKDRIDFLVENNLEMTFDKGKIYEGDIYFIDEDTGYKCWICIENKNNIRCGVQATKGHPMNTEVCSWYLVDTYDDNIDKAKDTCKNLSKEIYKYDNRQRQT